MADEVETEPEVSADAEGDDFVEEIEVVDDEGDAPVPPFSIKRKKPKKKKKKKSLVPPASSRPVIGRLTQYEIEERRGHVEKLRTHGLGVRQIAKTLGVPEFTVERDLKAVHEQNRNKISLFEKERHLGDSLARFEQLRQESWVRYHNAKEDRHKLKALELLVSLEKETTGMLIDTGIIVKPKEAPQEVKVAHTLQLDWSPEMQANVANALLQQSLKSTLAEPTLEALPPIADAVVVEVAPKTETLDEDPET